MAGRSLATVVAVGLVGLVVQPASAQGRRAIRFGADVLPLLQRRCLSCHGGSAAGGFRVDSYQAVMAGGAGGPAVAPGRGSDSRLIKYLDGRLQPRMPKGSGPLTRDQILLISNWIDQGARQGDDAGAAPGVKGTIGTVTAPGPGQEAKLAILQPADGSSVKETVKIQIPRAAVPQGGFLGIYIDGRFRAAVAAQTDEELADLGLPLDSPVLYSWDTHAPLVDNNSALKEERFAAEGPHILEVRSYNGMGGLVDTARVNVILKNAVDTQPNRPLKLWYVGLQGKQYSLDYTVDLEAVSATAVANAGAALQQGGFGGSGFSGGGGGFGTAGAATDAGSGPGSGGFGGGAMGPGGGAMGPGGGSFGGGATGGDQFTQKEFARYLVSLEDFGAGGLSAFWRERRDSPLTVTLNGVKSVIVLDGTSRYYGLNRRGDSQLSKVMEREKRIPIITPITLPGSLHRMEAPFESTVRIPLGAYIPGGFEIERCQARIDGLEWMFGERCVKISLTYPHGKTKVDIQSVGLFGADFEVSQGTTTVWFSETTQRVVKTTHDITGTIIVDQAQANPGGGSFGGPGGDLGPGSFGGPGAGGPGAGGMMGAGGGGFGSPFAGAGGPGAGGMMGAGGGGFGAPFGGGGFGGGSGVPQSQAELSGLASTKKRYHAKLKVELKLTPDKEKKSQ